MHNIISQNQLAEWKHFDTNRCDFTSQEENIDEYFACMIDAMSPEAKRICQRLLC